MPVCRSNIHDMPQKPLIQGQRAVIQTFTLPAAMAQSLRAAADERHLTVSALLRSIIHDAGLEPADPA